MQYTSVMPYGSAPMQQQVVSQSPIVYSTPLAPSVVQQPAPMEVVQYQPFPAQSNAVVAYSPPAAANAVVPYQKPQREWLYASEADRDTNPGDVAPLRKVMYSGAMWKPFMDEAYFCAHLSHQTTKSSLAVPGEVLQFQSSTSKTSTLQVIAVSTETPEIAWRILSDGRTTYVIFRGSSEWMYPLFESKLAVLHDVAPKTNVKVNNLFLHDLIPHMPDIISALKSAPTRRVVLAGHGNGGGLATICFLLLQRAGYARHQLVVYTYGSPLVTCGNLGMGHRPLPYQFSKAIFNFVNESDFIPCLLGNKDIHTVDALVSSVYRRENPLKNGLHSVHDIKAYRPIGQYYHLTPMNTMMDVPEGQGKAFLDVNRTGTALSERLMQHHVNRYVSKLRHVVRDN